MCVWVRAKGVVHNCQHLFIRTKHTEGSRPAYYYLLMSAACQKIRPPLRCARPHSEPLRNYYCLKSRKWHRNSQLSWRFTQICGKQHHGVVKKYKALTFNYIHELCHNMVTSIYFYWKIFNILRGYDNV